MKIISPLFVMLPRKTKEDKKIILNLNNYPHWHYITYNNAKVEYSKLFSELLKGVRFDTPITITYTLYKASNRKSDRMNVLAVIDKFFCDALVNHKCIEDDTDEYIESQHFYSAGVDKNNPRTEITICQK